MRSLPRVVAFSCPDPAPPEIYPLSLHDALPISRAAPQTADPGEKTAPRRGRHRPGWVGAAPRRESLAACCATFSRSEEHTSELQSLRHLVCRLLLEKKKDIHPDTSPHAYLHQRA